MEQGEMGVKDFEGMLALYGLTPDDARQPQ